MSVKTDALRPVPNPTVLVAQQQGTSQSTVQLTGNANGDTPGIPMDVEAPVTVRLEETVVNTLGGTFTGTTVGQQLTQVPADSLPASATGIRLTYYQPVARYLAFSPAYATTDRESGWEALSTTGFNAWAAELPTSAVISNYFAYAVGAHDTSYQHGVYLRTEENVDLGPEGMELTIGRDGYSYPDPGGPAVSTKHVGSSPQGNQLEATVQSVNSLHLVLQLSGQLTEGTNLVLVAHPDGAGTTRRAESLSQPQAPAGALCTPDVSGAADGCPLGSCDPGYECLPCGPLLCEVEHNPIGTAVCEPCEGVDKKKDVCSYYEGGVTVKVTIGPPSGAIGLELGASGKVGGKKCTTTDPHPGFCARSFVCYTVCNLTCHKPDWYVHALPIPPCLGTLQDHTTYCLDSDSVYESAAVCQHDVCEDE